MTISDLVNKIKYAVLFMKRNDLFVVSEEYIKFPENKKEESKDANYTGFDVVSITHSELTSDNFWSVEQELIMRRRPKDLDKWEEKSFKVKAIDRNHNGALTVTHTAIINHMNSLSGDLFNEDIVKEKEEE